MIPLLLDTCAAIWVAEDEAVSAAAAEAIDNAGNEGVPVFVSPMSAWEVGLLVSRKRLTVSMNPEAWFEQLLSIEGMALAALTSRILIASSFLPGAPPRDPIDRILAATARETGCCLITRDRQLLDYAGEGHIAALAC